MQAMQSPLITVLIPAYNAASFIHRAIDSAAAQTVTSLEILVIDDCSTDDTVNAVKALARTEARIRLIELPGNGGPAVARNVGLREALGQWIAVLDADDAYTNDRLERMLDYGERHAADIVADNFYYYDAPTSTVGDAGLATSPEWEVISLEKFIAGARPLQAESDFGLLKPMFRTDYMRKNAFQYPTNVRHGEDFMLDVACLAAGAKLILVRMPGYMYTTRTSGMSRTTVNYDSQAKDTLALLNDTTITKSAVIADLLVQRAKALRTFGNRQQLNQLIASRNLQGIGRLLIRHPSLTSSLINRIILRVQTRTASTH